MDIAEITPIEVWARIFAFVLQAEGRRCVCDKLYKEEVRAATCGGVPRVCRRFKLGWSRMIMNMLHQKPMSICTHPFECLLAYQFRAPRSPFLVLKSNPLWKPASDSPKQ